MIMGSQQNAGTKDLTLRRLSRRQQAAKALLFFGC